jgi:hypothetical protein
MSAITVGVVDETSARKVVNQFTLRLASERVTARELVRNRIRAEVDAFNASSAEIYCGLVQPTDTERALNGYRLKRRVPIDWKAQARRAEEAFEQNGFLLFVDDEQIDSLDAPLTVRPGARLTFLKLVPLVGG